MLVSCGKKTEILEITTKDSYEMVEVFKSMDSLLRMIHVPNSADGNPCAFHMNGERLKFGWIDGGAIDSLESSNNLFFQNLDSSHVFLFKKNLNFLRMHKIESGKFDGDCHIYLYVFDRGIKDSYYEIQFITSHEWVKERIDCIAKNYEIIYDNRKIIILQRKS